VSATRKHNVRGISNGLHGSEAQDSTSGIEMGTVITSEEAACGTKAKRKTPGCKAKRARYRRFKEQLKDTVMTVPHLVDAQRGLATQLQNDVRKQQWLMNHLTMCKLQQLKIQGGALYDRSCSKP